MSLEELKSDYQAITTQLSEMNPALTTAPELVTFLRNNLVPFQENLINELGELDETVADLYNNAEDILQPETGGLIAATLALGIGIIEKLKGRLVATSLEDTKVAKAIKEWERMSKEAVETISEITIPTEEDEDEDEEGEDAEDEDEDETDEEEAK